MVLPEWVAPNPPTEPALKPKFDWVVVLVPPGWVAPNLPTELALKCKLALKSKFCCLPPTLGGVNVTSGFAPPMLKLMAAMGVLLGDAVIVLVFVAAVVTMVAICIPPGDKGIVLVFAATAAAAAIV